MIALIAAILIPLSPTPVPDPPPYFGSDIVLLPTYETNGDGTRMQCTPTQSFCWPSADGLPSYLS
jgi:hypothetical protein